MVLRWRNSLIAITTAAQFASATVAAAEPLALQYSATWGGGTAAEIRLSLDENGRAFRNQLEIETVGLARFLSGFRAQIISQGETGSAVAPTAFDAVYDSRRKRDKRISVLFTRLADGVIAKDGPADTSTDQQLPEQFRRDVIDPLSSLTAIRQLIREGRLTLTQSFALAVYDGKRRFDVEGNVTSRGTSRWGKIKIPIVDLRLLLRPVAGFHSDGDDGEKPDAVTRELLATFTDDSRAIPLRMSVPIAYVPAVIVLHRDTRF